jgi:DNA-binding response OmpR family regulator
LHSDAPSSVADARSIATKGDPLGVARNTGFRLDAQGESLARGSTILLVEDDPTIASMMSDVLESSGYQVRIAFSGAEARASIEENKPELIILDLVLPDEDGLVLCSVFKNQAQVPVLVCSGTHRRRDAYLSLKLGADDFIAKPFDVYDLLARVEVLLRRSAHHVADTTQTRGPIRIGELAIDHASHQVTLGDLVLQLTPTEYRLLTVLASRPDQVVPRDALARLVWGDPDTGTSRTIDVHIGRLRMKLAQASHSAPQILSVRGFGYKIVAPPTIAPRLDGTREDHLSLADGLLG